MSYDPCEAIALRTIPSPNYPGYATKRGEIVPAVTQYRIDKTTGVTSFCSHGGECLPAKSLKLRPGCKINMSNDYNHASEPDRLYGIDIISPWLIRKVARY